MKRLCAVLLIVSLAVALPAVVLGSDMFPKPPVPSSRDKITAKAKTDKGKNSGGQGAIKLGKVVKGGEANKTTTAKPPASLQ